MDSDDSTGSPSEFLSLVGNSDTPTQPVSADAPETEPFAADDSADEGADDDLTPEERVAAVLAQDSEDTGEEIAEADTDEEDEALAAEADDEDEPKLSQEAIDELVAEALRLREEKAEQEALAAENTIVASADSAIAQAEAHYDREEQRLLQQVWRDAQNAPDPEAYFFQHSAAAKRNTKAQKDAWIGAIVERTNNDLTVARQERLKPQYAEWLAEQKGLPKNAIPKILEIGDVSRMAWWADQLVAQVNTARTQRRKANQRVREEAAKASAATTVHSPATGRARSGKVVELKGLPEEFLEMRRRGFA